MKFSFLKNLFSKKEKKINQQEITKVLPMKRIIINDDNHGPDCKCEECNNYDHGIYCGCDKCEKNYSSDTLEEEYYHKYDDYCDCSTCRQKREIEFYFEIRRNFPGDFYHNE